MASNPYLMNKNITANISPGSSAPANSAVANIVVNNPAQVPKKKASPYSEQYKGQSVSNMTQGEMLIKLYDEIIKQINLAIDSIDEQESFEDFAEKNNAIETTNIALTKTQKIINHLRMILNFDIDSKEIPIALEQLYGYFNKCVVDSNIKNDNKSLKEILPLVQDLRDTYFEVEQNLKSGKK